MPTSTPTPLERLLAEQAARWGAGDRVPAEALIAEHPEVAGDDAALPALKQAEGRLRQTAVETVSLAKAGARPPTDEAPGTGVATVPHVEAATATDERGRPPRLPTIPGYTIKREIKCGGMGAVYEAEQEGLKRRCAIKLMLAGRMAGAAEVARFRAEAEALGQVEHDGVVGVYGWGDHEGLLFLVMEYMPRGSLWDRVGGKPLPAEEAAALVKGLAEAVHHVHGVKHAAGVGIVHRDLKPQNILIDAEGRAKVSDFGLARLVGAEGVTESGASAGTPGYMAPEQAEDLKRAGVPADVWGLGAVLYACLSGRPPFVGNKVEVLLRTCHEEPAQLPAGTPAGLAEIVLKCLEKQPARRYPTAQALADDLGRWLDRQRPEAQLGVVGRVGRWARRNPRRAFLASLLGAAPVVGLGGYWTWGRRRPTEADLLEQELAKGVGAELLDGEGQPRDARILLGEGRSTLSRHLDGAFTVQSSRLCLVGLATGTGMERFIFRGQIRHQNLPDGEVGLFAAYRQDGHQGGMLHTFVQAGFSDLLDEGAGWDLAVQLRGQPPPDQPVRPINRIHMHGTIFGGSGWDDLGQTYSTRRQPEVFIPGNPDAPAWRSFALEITPRAARAAWLGRPVAELDAVRFATSLERGCREAAGGRAAGFKPVFSHAGGVGVFVFAAVASFRALRLIPLP